jgi:transcriptional regulator with XRE-family HTH domain
MNSSSSPYLNFAENLRLMSITKSSIAQVCRDLGMNRQQFNKYLSGTNLPGPATLEKIATYFRVDQRSMFDSLAHNHDGFGEVAFSAERSFGQVEQSILASLTKNLAGSQTTKFQEGCYQIYFPGMQDPNEIVRAMMIVFKVGKVTCFRRYTKIKSRNDLRTQFTLGRHEGIIIEQNGRTFLLGKNLRGFGELSLISFGASTTPALGTMTGLAMVFTGWAEPMATRVTVSYFGSKNDFRRAVALCGIIPSNSDDIPEYIKKSVSGPVEFPAAMLLPYGIFDDLKPNWNNN